MAYETSNPPVCMKERFGSGPALWVYVDGDTTSSTIDVDDYFSNGDALGLKVNDIMFVVGGVGGTLTGTMHVVETVTAGGAASIKAATLA
jgi:hypothetical protein